MMWRTPWPSDVLSFQYSKPVTGYRRSSLFRSTWKLSFMSRPEAMASRDVVRVMTRSLRRFAV